MLVDTGAPALAGWESFYVIVGSSGAALIGLQFVVIALIAANAVPSTHEQIGAFGTPTIVHFSADVFIAASMSVPWPSLADVHYVLGACGLAGMIYMATSIRRARRQTGYALVLEDWIWHVILPVVAYGALLGAAYQLRAHSVGALFVVAGVALLLLFIGIHNAWDTVIFIALDNPTSAGRSQADDTR